MLQTYRTNSRQGMLLDAALIEAEEFRVEPLAFLSYSVP